MNKSHLRNTLIVVGIAVSLGVGISGCSKTADQSSGQASATQDVTDKDITTGVRSELAKNRGLDTAGLTIATSDGTVTLTGTVRDIAASTAVETAARNFAGVTKVNNRLSISNPGMGAAAKQGKQPAEAADDTAAQVVSDTWITSKVKSVLLADSEAKGLDVTVETRGGVVTLEGELTTQADVDHVKALAMEVEGVKRVNFSALTVATR